MIVCLFNKQILQNKDHPINMLCKIFRESFWDSLNKYAVPKKKSGIVDKASTIQLYKEKTEELKKEFNDNDNQSANLQNSINNISRDLEGDTNINLTN